MSHFSDKQKFSRKASFYRKNTEMLCDEDLHHEFKCHCAMAVEDLPPWTQKPHSRTKRAISRAINAFLNSNEGGTIYLGVADTGIVEGLKMTLFQKDHLKANLGNLLLRYKPSVPKERISIRFVPVVNQNLPEEEALKMCLAIQDEELKIPEGHEHRQKPHLCRTYEKCWCWNEFESLFSSPKVQAYVVEIGVNPWNSQLPKWDFLTPKVHIQPLHLNEEGLIFIRTMASVTKLNPQDIVKITQQRVDEFFQVKLEKVLKTINS